jgi:anti-sigma factor RsiW
MKCQSREKLFLFAQQMMDPEESEGVRRHVATCADCARAVEEFRKLDSALDDWAVAEPSPWFDAKVRAKVAVSGRNWAGFFGFGRLRELAAGVAVIVLILAAVVVFNHQKVAENNQPAITHQQHVATSTQPQTPATIEALRQPLAPEEQLKMDENLSVLEDYDVVANFDALSELPQANKN